MRIGIVGNGLAGVIAAKTLRDLGSDAEISVFAREPYHYYPRPNLIEYLAGTLPLERVFAFPEAWYEERRIAVRLKTPVLRISGDRPEVETGAGKPDRFDALLLSDGASPAIPPSRGADKKGVFTLRTLDDARSILAHLPSRPEVVILGGGLLGLEIGRALQQRGARVEVVEFIDRLLPRQLDRRGADHLKSWIERSGLRVRLAAATEEILGDGDVSGLLFKGGERISASMAILAAGVRPNIELAQAAGLAVDGGVVVNDLLQTTHPRIFAAGDNTCHRGRVYGIIPASFDQARLAAANLLGRKQVYEGTVLSHTLKVAGVYVTSVGVIAPDGPGIEEVIKEDRERGIYKKILLRDGALIGAIWMGTKRGAAEISRAAAKRLAVGRWKSSLLEDDFDFGLL
jgi:nitrite reductase (NADH) large subunit